MAKSDKSQTNQGKKPKRLTFRQICYILKVSPRQRVKLWKYYQAKLRGGVL